MYHTILVDPFLRALATVALAALVLGGIPVLLLVKKELPNKIPATGEFCWVHGAYYSPKGLKVAEVRWIIFTWAWWAYAFKDGQMSLLLLRGINDKAALVQVVEDCYDPALTKVRAEWTSIKPGAVTGA